MQETADNCTRQLTLITGFVIPDFTASVWSGSTITPRNGRSLFFCRRSRLCRRGQSPLLRGWRRALIRIEDVAHGVSLDPVFGGPGEGNCWNFFPAFSLTIVSAAFRLSCDRNASVAPNTIVVILPPPLRSFTHILMNVPMTTTSRIKITNSDSVSSMDTPNPGVENGVVLVA
jgi:hypothetical protein